MKRHGRQFDGEGRLLNSDHCVGEIVNTLGVGPFEGYYRNEEAMRHTTRNGWYWSGDLGYVDEDGWVFFAGRTSDWLRVDGENFPAAPIEAIIGRHPEVMLASVYGVPDPDSGDRVMVRSFCKRASTSTSSLHPGWTARRISARMAAGFVRLCTTLPSTPTNKVLTRTLATRSSAPTVSVKIPCSCTRCVVRPLTQADESHLRVAFEANGRVPRGTSDFLSVAPVGLRGGTVQSPDRRGGARCRRRGEWIAVRPRTETRGALGGKREPGHVCPAPGPE